MKISNTPGISFSFIWVYCGRLPWQQTMTWQKVTGQTICFQTYVKFLLRLRNPAKFAFSREAVSGDLYWLPAIQLSIMAVHAQYRATAPLNLDWKHLFLISLLVSFKTKTSSQSKICRWYFFLKEHSNEGQVSSNSNASTTFSPSEIKLNHSEVETRKL